jgi:hypothetical protein
MIGESVVRVFLKETADRESRSGADPKPQGCPLDALGSAHCD